MQVPAASVGAGQAERLQRPSAGAFVPARVWEGYLFARRPLFTLLAISKTSVASSALVLTTGRAKRSGRRRSGRPPRCRSDSFADSW